MFTRFHLVPEIPRFPLWFLVWVSGGRLRFPQKDASNRLDERHGFVCDQSSWARFVPGRPATMTMSHWKVSQQL